MNTGWIRERLKKVGATQGDLATAIGRDRAVVSRIVQGRQPLAVEWIAPFAGILRVSPGELLERIGVVDAGHSVAPARAGRLIVAMSGASGVVYGIRLLELLKRSGIETHFVMSRAAARTVALETNRTAKEVAGLAHTHYPAGDIGAAIASGSFRCAGMIVAPCSIRTMSEIATGVTSTLLTRAADTVLKERRRLVLMVRETPLHIGHLRTMTQLSEMGAIIFPPVPAFYAAPATLEDIVTQSVARILDLFDIEIPETVRWEGAPPAP